MPAFPKTILDFQDRFGTERACWDYLVNVRWPNEAVVCPRCGDSAKTFISTRNRWACVREHQWSVTAGTIMHGSHVGLRKWFWAAYLVATQTPGISAMVLHRQIGVCYETAYMILQRIRAEMVNPERTKLNAYAYIIMEPDFLFERWPQAGRFIAEIAEEFGMPMDLSEEDKKMILATIVRASERPYEPVEVTP